MTWKKVTSFAKPSIFFDRNPDFWTVLAFSTQNDIRIPDEEKRVLVFLFLTFSIKVYVRIHDKRKCWYYQESWHYVRIREFLRSSATPLNVGGKGCAHLMHKPQSWDNWPSHPYNTWAEHVGFFTDQACIACTKREAPWGVWWVAWGMSCIILWATCEADFRTLCALSAYRMTAPNELEGRE